MKDGEVANTSPHIAHKFMDVNRHMREKYITAATPLVKKLIKINVARVV